MTGLKCPRAKCVGVVPQHCAVGTFRFSGPEDAPQEDEDRATTNGAPSSLPLSPASEPAVPELGIDTFRKVQSETQSGQARGVGDSQGGVCSDCDLDPPEVVCRECGGRLLCLECDSHVHQPRSKRRGGHVRERIRSETGSGEENVVGRGESSTAVDSDTVDGDTAKDSIGRKQTDREALGAPTAASTAVSLAERSQVSSVKREDRNGEHDRTDTETVTNDRSTGVSNAAPPPQTSGSSETTPTVGSSKATQHTGISKSPLLNTELANSQIGYRSDDSGVNKVERGRCTACGTAVDVSAVLARVEAAWSGAKGRMPYLEAAEEALAVATGALHPLNRKLAEVRPVLVPLQGCAD